MTPHTHQLLQQARYDKQAKRGHTASGDTRTTTTGETASTARLALRGNAPQAHIYVFFFLLLFFTNFMLFLNNREGTRRPEEHQPKWDARGGPRKSEEAPPTAGRAPVGTREARGSNDNNTRGVPTTMGPAALGDGELPPTR
jgi:hypothetical protein